MSHNLYYSELEKNHKWNSLMNILDACFFQIGFVCFIPAVIIVAYLKHYTDNEVILNLPVFISNFTMAIGPFIMSFYSGRIKRKKRAAMITNFWYRVLWLPVILVVWFLSGTKGWIIPAFLTAFTLFYILWGISVIFWQEMVGRALAPDKFASSMGIRESISRIVGFVASMAVVVIMSRMVFPNNFLVLFSISFVSWFISLYWLSRMKEAPYDEISDEKPTGHLKNMILLPVKDASFRWFVIFIIFSYGHLFLGGLFTVVGIERFKGYIGQDQLTGILGILTTLSSSVFAFTIGKISERLGRLWGYIALTTVNIILPICMNFCYNYYFYLFIMFMSGVIYTIWILEFTTILGFTTPERRHEYIAFTSLIKLIPIVLYTNMGGYMANSLSPAVTFFVSSAFCFIGLLVLVFKLRPLWVANKN